MAALHYDINEVGEMHHNPAKNVLYVRASVGEIAKPNEPDRRNASTNCWQSAKKKMYAARLQRPTPYVDKTVYVGWNSLCVSAYLEAAKVFGSRRMRGGLRCGRWIGCWRRPGRLERKEKAGESPAATQGSCCTWSLILILRLRIAKLPDCSRTMRSPRWLASTLTRRLPT